MTDRPAGEIETARLLLDAARYLGETLEPHRVYERFHELLTEAVPHNGVVVSSYDEQERSIRCDYAWVDGELLDVSIFPVLTLQEQSGMQSQVIRTGEPLLTNDVAGRVQDSGTYYDVDREGTMRKVPDEGAPKAQAAMMLPIKQEGRVVGVVQLMSDHASYDRSQVDLAEGMVAQLGAAVRNARLHEEALRLEATAAAARAVADERERAEQVLDAVGEGIFFVSDGGSVTFWNRAAESITGISAAEARGRSLRELGVGWRLLEDSAPLAGPGERPRSILLPVDVAPQELWLSFVAVETGGGVVYAFRDMTSERQLEQAKHEFVATVAHELRTPMTAVLGAAMTLLRPDIDLAPDVRRRLLEMIAAQATRLSKVTESLLLADRLERGVLLVERSRVDVDLVARAAAAAVEPTLPPSLEIEQELGAPGVAVGDVNGLQQVVINLLDNAAKYASGGEVILVRTSRRENDVRIEVADRGPGIEASERRRIFEKFYRSPATQALAPTGTGLGLYICAELVDRMGGRLTVESAAGAGSTFAVTLPAAS